MTRKKPKEKSVYWEKYARLLGKMSDYKLAEMLSITPEAVRQQRDKRGIAPYYKRDTRQKHIDWDRQPLGEMYDTVLGRKLGVSHTTVGVARRERGIPKYSPGE